MNKAAVRLKIIDLMDNNCAGCEHKRDSNASYCWTKCEIGKEINALGIYLGGTLIEKEVKVRTPKDWDKLCI
ncbi:zinc-finger domain-containing protein, partial [Lysinibacillus sp. GbtcB16]